jgi:tetratricopeptide (TPR) repeat protein
LEKRGKWYLASIYTGRGNIYRDIKDYKNAMAEYKKSLEIYPDYSWTFESMGIMFGLQKDFENAILNIKKATEMDSGFGRYYASLGRAYAKKADSENDVNKKRDLENAETHFMKGVQAEPGNMWLYFHLAYFYLDHEMLDKAERAFVDIYALSRDEVDKTEALYQLRQIDPQYSEIRIQTEGTENKELPPIAQATPKP